MSMLVPFGPQHPVLPEPLQLRLELNDEKVVSAVPVVGYVHRGLEKLAEQKDFVQDTFLIERVCGICSFMHSMAYSMGIEELMGIQIPDRARYLRVVWAELHRMHSHLLALGLLADAFGFENLFLQHLEDPGRDHGQGISLRQHPIPDLVLHMVILHACRLLSGK